MEISLNNIAGPGHYHQDAALKGITDKDARKRIEELTEGIGFKGEGEEKDPVVEQKEASEVAELRNTEQRVRAHEIAHSAVGGRYAGSPSYSYTKGPDGKMYITGGEVSIDTGSTGTPEETIQKMRQVRAAALAPGDPSPQDSAIAAKASATEMNARREISSRDNAEAALAAEERAQKKPTEGDETIELFGKEDTKETNKDTTPISISLYA